MPALFGNIGTVVNMAQAVNGNALGNVYMRLNFKQLMPQALAL
jgi:hypothetical protein